MLSDSDARRLCVSANGIRIDVPKCCIKVAEVGIVLHVHISLRMVTIEAVHIMSLNKQKMQSAFSSILSEDANEL